MKSFMLKCSNIQRDSDVWNMAGSMLFAFQSVIFLMILTRTVGLVAIEISIVKMTSFYAISIV